MVFVACSKKIEYTPAKQPLSSVELTSMQWCTIDNIAPNFQSVSRYSFTRGTPNTFTVSDLRLADNKSPVVYNSEATYKWALKNSHLLYSSDYIVELIEGEFQHTALNSTEAQKLLRDKIAKMYPTLKIAAEPFNPQIAVRISRSDTYTGHNSSLVTTLYPCSTYSPSFVADAGPSRSILEFNISLGQTIWEYDSQLEKTSLAKQMSLQFPLEELNISSDIQKNLPKFLELQKGFIKYEL